MGTNYATMPNGWKKGLRSFGLARRGGSSYSGGCTCGKKGGMCRDCRGMNNCSKGFGHSLVDYRGRCVLQGSQWQQEVGADDDYYWDDYGSDYWPPARQSQP